MSITMDEEIKRWTAKRKSALVMEIIQGKTTVAEAARAFDLPPSEIEEWVDDAKRGMENALRAKPLDIREQYEKQLKELQEAYGEAMLELRARKSWPPAGRGRQIVADVQQGLRAEGIDVSVSKLCRWFGLPRRSWYYRSVKAAPKLQEHLVTPIKNMIERTHRSVTGRLQPCWGSTRTRYSASSSSRAGKFASVRLGFAPGSEPCLRWPQRPTNAGRRTYAGSGLVAMAGVPWRW
ncbi:transposase [Salmonella enterica]|uniref:transposase n=1 Tax=Salmonella enterica TaxID=28901 RepID=UPI001ADE4E45|nr:transposase [Salmonella enterica]